MNFGKLFFFVFACVLALSSVSAAPKWKIFKKIVEERELGKDTTNLIKIELNIIVYLQKQWAMLGKDF
ncbi:unnamed protein product [Pieris macdunnoughi]|uniref:Uncharacterized protein n=1 Tax=Pieris macdunnoughi TaxID=345717 RepID=A0A821T495_9NEOP|nr:unnamed protein product [Pieris macdunnoughi]